jgi:Tfp pilus assembly protein PilX
VPLQPWLLPVLPLPQRSHALLLVLLVLVLVHLLGFVAVEREGNTAG